MSWFEDSNIKKSYIVQTVSDVGIFSACTQIYLTNILPCAGDTINITGNLGVSGNISGTTYYGDGSQLSGIVTTDNYVTGGVYSASTETLYFTGTTGFTPFSVDVSALLDDTNSYVTGGTYNPTTDIVTLTRNDNVSINITGVSNTFTTGATYDEGTELITFVRNDGNTYTADLSAIVSATTNSYTTGATLNGNIIEFANSVLGLNYYSVDLTPIVSGKVETSLFNTYTADTQTTLNSKLDTTSFNTYSGNVETQLSNKTDNSNFTSHTGDTTIHYTKGSINLSDLGSSAHTHTLSEITDFNTYSGDVQTQLDGKVETTAFNSHTANTNNPHQTSFTNLTSTAHTHSINEVINLQTELDSKLNISDFNTYSGTVQTELDSKVESSSNIGGANEVFSGKSGTDLQFRTISGGSNTTITTVGGIIKIDTTGGGSTTPTLQEVLSSGNTTSGNDIIMTEGDDVVFKYSGWNNRINTQPLTTHRGINFPDNDGTVALVSDTTGYTETTLFNTYTGDTETALNSKLDTTSFNVYSGSVETQLNSKTDNTDFTSHTGDTTIHYTKGSINLSDLGSSAHTHSISEVVNLQTELDNKLATTTFNSYTGSVVDVFVSSGNANAATQQLSFTNTTGGTFNVTNAAALFSDNDINVTGGTYNPTTGCVTFTTNSGTTFDVCGFVTGITDTFVTGYTYSDNTFTLSRNQGLADLTSTINTMTGLTVNGVLSATTYTGITLDGIDDVTTNIPASPDNTYQGELLYFDAVNNQWVSNSDYGNLGDVTIWGKKGSAGTIDKGCPVYITGFNNDIHEVELANATTATTMPVIGFTAEDFDNAGVYPIITFGKVSGLDTTSTVSTLNPNGETWAVNDVLYMNTTDGGLTKNRPTGTNTQIQRIAKVLKINATSGQLFIFNTARTAGLPNLTTDYVWLGDGNDTPQEVIKTDLGVSVTGFSYDNNNTFTITDDNSGSYTATINQMSGLTVDGTLTLNSVGGTTSVTNLGIDSSGNIVSGFSVTVGSNDQIPYSNSGGTDFDYTNNFRFNGNVLVLDNGNNTVSIGSGANNTGTDSESVFIGKNAGTHDKGFRNIMIGAETGAPSSGAATNSNNILIGYQAGTDANGMSSTIAIGSNAFSSMGSGARNVAVGDTAGGNMASGTDNVLIGVSAGENITSGSGNVIIGPGVMAGSTTSSNQFKLGYFTTTLMSGNFSTKTLSIGNYTFNTQAVAGPGQDDFALIYNNGTGYIGLEAITESMISDLGTYAKVGTYTNNYVPRWNATTNTLQSGTIQDSGSNVHVGGSPDSTAKLKVSKGSGTAEGIYVDVSNGGGNGARIEMKNSSGTTAQTGLYVRNFSNSSASGNIKGITILTETDTTSKTIDSVFGIQIQNMDLNSNTTVNKLYQLILGDTGSAVKGTGEFYGIYQADSDLKNYFGGQLQLNTIGSGTPVTNLGVDASGNVVSGDTGGDVFKVGTPANNQIGVWTGDGTLEGDSNLTWNGAALGIRDASNNETDIRAAFILNKSESDDANLYLYGYGTGHKGEIIMAAANGTIASPTATTNGNIIATIQAYGHTGTAHRLGGSISFSATENFVDATAYGTRFVLQTTINGDTSPTTRYNTTDTGDHQFIGSLGINTNSFASNEYLKIYGSGAQYMTIESTDNTSGIFLRANTGVTPNNWRLYATSNSFYIRDEDAAADRLNIDSIGNVKVYGELNVGTVGGTTSVTNLGIDASGNVVSGTTGGNVSNTGTPVNNQVAVWTNSTTIEGDSNFIWDGGLDMSSTTQFGVDLTHNPSGTDSTIAGYNVDLTGNVDSDNTYGFYSKVNTSLNGNAYGGYFRVLDSFGNAMGSLNQVNGSVGGISYGAHNSVLISGSNTSGSNMYGSLNVVTLSTTGTHGPSIIGSGVDLNYNKVGGTLTSAFGFYSTGIVCNDSGSTVTNAYGLYLGDNAGAGTITNSFGVYQAGTDDKNYFAGQITTNNGIIYDPVAGDADIDIIEIGVTGSPKIYWDESENSFRLTTATWLVDTQIGIGSPSFGSGEKIEVKGTGNQYIRIESTDTNDAGLFLQSGAGGSVHDWLVYSNSADFKIRDVDNATDRLIIDSIGNVGINTNSPTQKLHIYDSFANSLANFESGDERVNIRFNDSLTTNTPIIGASGNTITFGHISGGDKVSILESGNVGIGTETPTEKLDVSGNVKISGELNVGTVGGTTSVTNLGIDSNGNVVSGSTISNTPVVSTYRIDANVDATLYTDSEIEITWDVSQTDIDMEILTNPSTNQVHVTKTKDGADTTFDLEISDGVVQIEGAMGNDDKIDISVFAPSDSTYPHYRIKIIKSSTLVYTNGPFLVIVEKWSSYS